MHAPNYLFITCGLILLPSELFRIVISCKIVYNSMKFKLIHEISVFQEKFSKRLCTSGFRGIAALNRHFQEKFNVCSVAQR